MEILSLFLIYFDCVISSFEKLKRNETLFFFIKFVAGFCHEGESWKALNKSRASLNDENVQNYKANLQNNLQDSVKFSFSLQFSEFVFPACKCLIKFRSVLSLCICNLVILPHFETSLRLETFCGELSRWKMLRMIVNFFLLRGKNVH